MGAWEGRRTTGEVHHDKEPGNRFLRCDGTVAVSAVLPYDPIGPLGWGEFFPGS